jgi:hypothetical protein
MKKTQVLLFLLIISVSACKKETVLPTAAEQTANVLKKVIAKSDIKRIIAWDDKSGFPTSISPTLGVGWTFSDGFISINGYGFGSYYSRNLLYLDSYDISNVVVTDGSNPVALILHFRN